MLVHEVGQGDFAKVSDQLAQLFEEGVNELGRDERAIDKLTLALVTQMKHTWLDDFDSDTNETCDIYE